MSNKRLFNNVSVQNKVFIILAVATAGLILVWGVNFVGAQINGGYQAEVERTTHLRTYIAKVEVGFLQERRNEKDFLFRLLDKYAGRHAKTAAEVNQNLDIAQGFAVEEEASEIESIRKTFMEYTDQFKVVFKMWQDLGLDEKSGLRGTLRSAVKEAEALINEHNAEAVTAAMLMLRRREKDFIIRTDPKYVDSHAKDMVTFFEKIDASSISGGDKGKIKNLVLGYENAFKEFASLRLETKEATKVLSAKYAIAEPVLFSLYDVVNLKEEEAEHALHDVQNQVQIIGMIAVIVIFVIVLGLALVVGRSIAIPIRSLSSQMRRISEGEELKVKVREGTDEVADMGNALAEFQANMQESIRLQQEAAKQQELELERGRKIDGLSKDFDEKITQVLEVVSSASTELDASAQTMSGIAIGSSERATAAASASEEATTNVQTVSAACEELSASIQEISRQSLQSNDLARQATADVERTEMVVQELSESANRINEVVAMISEIADQTNLLALNATIEAARAGEAGKGFAVVANEVKSLANQTGKATNEIGETIAVVLDKVSESVSAINSVTGRIGEIAEMISGIAASVDEQNSATSEISRNVEEAASGTSEVNRNVGEVSTMAEEAGNASGEVQRAAAELATQSVEMKKVVDHFLNGVRAV